ncbi:hypothetical protein CORC01_05516 [Colletotrichum orchidophilum]|uniref:Uncharacterized protein n=1 Tax=Colletotrichum orchidophilum TaxID=1209926 RepID=A0A1G4BD19_9PEZI|nr:uncharacterized protein CORC01_05516 [Colletotrichum orchidophilum]OHE99235.1 hypothetical protein CORC01_05516 [Colletotrichum orchidophilum]
MCDSPLSPGADKGNQWGHSSAASSPRSDTSSNTNSLFSSPESPTDTELSFPNLDVNEPKVSSARDQIDVTVMPSLANHVLVGQTAYTPGRIRAMSQQLQQARRTGEFPNTTSAAEYPQTIVEDYHHLQRLRDARGDPADPPPEKYNVLKVDIARLIKARDDAHGAPANFQEMDHRVQNWMNSINKEARMLEITQAALQRKGINNPTQDDLDAIAEEFMQIAERTLLDVANPLRMNATRMEGNMSRFDSQLDGMTSQIDGLSSLNNAVNTSMSAQVATLNKVMASQLNTLNTMLGAQKNTFDGSVNMLNTALNTVTTDLHQITSSLPAMIATAVQAAVNEQLAAMSHNQRLGGHTSTTFEKPPGYATATRVPQCSSTGREDFGGFAHSADSSTQVSVQQFGQAHHLSTPPTKSRFRRFLRAITGRQRSTKENDHKEEGRQ